MALPVLGCLLALSCPPALAGGGPENVALIVNTRSWSSQTIANHFADLRHIPEGNIIELDWTGPTDRIDIDTFRGELLDPILREIDGRQLSAHIDYVVYSSDFPYQIQYDSEAASNDRFPAASLTGLTYLWQARNLPEIYPGLNVNWYASQRGGDLGRGPTRGFRTLYAWTSEGERVTAPAENQLVQRYLLSTMLGYTGRRGNTVAEVIHGLRRSAMADGTQPAGTIYYCRNLADKARSGPREARSAFERAVVELEQLGVAAKVVDTVLPEGASDVQGAMVGTAKFDWPASRSVILPGAICENLTSFGAAFYQNGQTPLTEFLRYGAAGSSGTVIEPYNLQAKFPHPRIQVHYARGCTLAEAFYQSVYAPYQLLVVGDPLCRPWAKIPKVAATGFATDQPLSGAVTVQPQAALVDGQQLQHFEAFLDGAKVGVVESGTAFQIQTSNFDDGYHELRLIGIEDSPIETQGRHIVPMMFANHGQRVEARLANPRSWVGWNEPIRLQIVAPGATSLEVYQRERRVAKLDGERGLAQIDTRTLGSGPVRLRVAAVFAGPPERRAWTAPLRVEIGWPSDQP